MTTEIAMTSIPAAVISPATTIRFNETKPAAVDEAPGNEPDARQPNVVQLEATVSQINETIQTMRRELHFAVDQYSGRVVIKVIDADDGETIRQIPSEELLQLAQHFAEGETEGSLLKVTA